MEVDKQLGRIAFVQSGWHSEIVDQCRSAFVEEMEKQGFAESEIDFFEVPGAFEIPLHARALAASGRYRAVVAAGLVVDGGIYRHEFVADAVINGLMRAQLDSGVPVISSVLTPHHFHEHEVHRSFFRDHSWAKGAEAAWACARTLESLQRLPAPAESDFRLQRTQSDLESISVASASPLIGGALSLRAWPR